MVENDFAPQTSGEQTEPLVIILGILLGTGGDVSHVSHADSKGDSNVAFENRPRRGHGCFVRSPKAFGTSGPELHFLI